MEMRIGELSSKYLSFFPKFNLNISKDEFITFITYSLPTRAKKCTQIFHKLHKRDSTRN